MSLYVVEHEQGCDDVEVQEYDRDRDVYSLTSQNRSADSFFPQPFFYTFRYTLLGRLFKRLASCHVVGYLLPRL